MGTLVSIQLKKTDLIRLPKGVGKALNGMLEMLQGQTLFII